MNKKCVVGLMIIVLSIVVLIGCANEELSATNDSARASSADKESILPSDPSSSYNHEEDFSVVLVGTGCPIPSVDRSGPSTMIQYKGNYFLVDCGNGANLSLVKGGFNLKDMKVLMFTHLHSDHTSDFIDILTNSWMLGNKKLDIIGPPRTKKIHEFMLDFYRDDLVYRMYRSPSVNEDGMFKNVNIKEIIGENEFELYGVKISSAEMTHTMYNLAYRFDVDGKSIVISGDTSYDPDLEVLAKDADVLVMDGNVKPDGGAPIKRVEGSKPEPSEKYAGNFDVEPHVQLEDIATIAANANVKKLILTHLLPGTFDEESVISTISEKFKGEIVFGEDLQEINP